MLHGYITGKSLTRVAFIYRDNKEHIALEQNLAETLPQSTNREGRGETVRGERCWIGTQNGRETKEYLEKTLLWINQNGMQDNV